MDKTDNIDTYNLITDFKSLEDESLTMLGLDLDDALEKTKIKGFNIKKKIYIWQSVAAISLLILIIGLSTFLTFQAKGTAKTNILSELAIQNKGSVERTVEPKELTPSTTLAQPVVAPFTYPSFEVGNVAICNEPAPTQNEDGVMIGSSINAENFTTNIDRATYPIESTPGIINIVEPQANGGQYIKFVDGNFSSNSYRKQTPTGLTYCDATKKVSVDYSNTGYIVTTKNY